MRRGRRSTREILNQSFVRFQSGRYAGEAVSNEVVTNVHDDSGDLIDIEVSKMASAAEASRGDELVYTIRVENTGEAAAVVELTDTLPEGCMFLWGSVRAGAGSLPNANPAQGIALGTLLPGEQSVVSFRAAVPDIESASLPPLLENKAAVRATRRRKDGTFEVYRRESIPAVTRLYAPVIRIDVSIDPLTIEPHSLVEFKLTITNSGNAAASVTICDLVPAGMAVVPGSLRLEATDGPVQWHFAAGCVTAAVVKPGATVIVMYLAELDRHSLAERLQGRINGSYTYVINGITHTYRIFSGAYKILVEYPDE
ncbi:hypothetical protein ACFFK0_14755 [Paenibacillus chartarius]|uniref:DUF11 domain-containing protein n=1 Tax=Paenibacillus chartarius TaxID=747481 RepID=A0ABV6DM80_9BACL